jgi:hypothetical protein
MRAKRASILPQKARHFARLAQILRSAKRRKRLAQDDNY